MCYVIGNHLLGVIDCSVTMGARVQDMMTVCCVIGSHWLCAFGASAVGMASYVVSSQCAKKRVMCILAAANMPGVTNSLSSMRHG